MNYSLDLYAMYSDAENQQGRKEGLRPEHFHRFSEWTELEEGIVSLYGGNSFVNEFILDVVNHLVQHPKVYFIRDVKTFDDSYPYRPGIENKYRAKVLTLDLDIRKSRAEVFQRVDEWIHPSDCVYIVREIYYAPFCAYIHATMLGSWAGATAAIRGCLIDEILKNE